MINKNFLIAFLNLFLFFFAVWFIFMMSFSKVSWLYFYFGIISSTLVSLLSFRISFFKSDSEFLFLSLGFYKYFIEIFSKNFYESILLLIDLAFLSNRIKPVLAKIKVKSPIVSFGISMKVGLFSIITKEENLIIIHAIDEKYLKNLNLNKLESKLKNINDDNLV